MDARRLLAPACAERHLRVKEEATFARIDTDQAHVCQGLPEKAKRLTQRQRISLTFSFRLALVRPRPVGVIEHAAGCAPSVHRTPSATRAVARPACSDRILQQCGRVTQEHPNTKSTHLFVLRPLSNSENKNAVQRLAERHDRIGGSAGSFEHPIVSLA